MEWLDREPPESFLIYHSCGHKATKGTAEEDHVVLDTAWAVFEEVMFKRYHAA